MLPGKLIVFEGIDGSGTTTQTRLLAERLRRKGIKCHTTAEPSKGAIGKLIREILGGETYTYLKSLNNEELKVIMALLFSADRVDHIWTEIVPKLREGQVVICDRFLFSTLVYQLGVMTSREWLESLDRTGLKPDLTLYLRTDPLVAFRRLQTRWETEDSKPEIYETADSLGKHSYSYDVIFCRFPEENVTTVETSRVCGENEVALLVYSYVKDFLKKWGRV